jgi:hypothetical protein
LNEENRIIGWNAFYGEGSDAVNHSFQSFSDALQAARLANRPRMHNLEQSARSLYGA